MIARAGQLVFARRQVESRHAGQMPRSAYSFSENFWAKRALKTPTFRISPAFGLTKPKQKHNIATCWLNPMYPPLSPQLWAISSSETLKYPLMVYPLNNGEVFWVYVSWDTRYVSMISLLYSEYPIFPIKVPIVRCTQFSDTTFSHYRYGTATML